MKLSCTTRILAIALGLFCLAVRVQAAPSQPIIGSIDFGGVVTFDTLSLATATKVMQWNNSFVLQDSGSFSNISPGTNASMAPQWLFNPGSPSTPSPGPATSGLWNVGGFVFDLSVSNVMPGQSTHFLHVTGTGTVSGNSFQATPGIWSFTVSNSNGQDQTTFGFQANATAVPEAGTLTLFAIGAASLVGAGLKNRKPRRSL